MSIKYFTDENLKTLITWINEKYMKYDEAKINAGLIVEKLEVEEGVDEDGSTYKIFNVGENGLIQQGKCYIASEPVSKIIFNPYSILNDNIMGEVDIQFRTAGNFIGADYKDSVADWKWINTNNGLPPVFKKNSTYQIKLTSDQLGTVFAEVNSFETININGGDVQQTSSFVKISYNPATTDFMPLSNNWLNNSNNNISQLLYAADGSNYTIIELDSLKKSNNLTRASMEKKPVLMITFNESGMVDLSELLNNISFDAFKIGINANRILNMCGMFRSTSNKVTSCTSIDMTGITNPSGFFENIECNPLMFVSMFEGRKISNDSEGKNLKLFDVDVDGNYSGLDTSKATTLSRMFYNGAISDRYVSGSNNIFKRLRMDSCYDFSYMFYGCNLSDVYMEDCMQNINWEMRTKAFKGELSYESMFENTNITDNALTQINGFVNTLSQYFNHNNQSHVSVYNLRRLFKGCKYLEDLYRFDMSHIFEYENQMERFIATEIFANCESALAAPNVRIISNETELTNLIQILMDGMFEGAFNNNSNVDLGNVGNWVIDLYNNNDIILDMSRMFAECPLYKLNKALDICNDQSSINLIKEDGPGGEEGSIYGSRLVCNEMFIGTAGTGSYSVNWNLKTGVVPSTGKLLPGSEFNNMLDFDNDKGYIYINDGVDSSLYKVLKSLYKDTHLDKSIIANELLK